jgi:hypothetical protein
MASLAGSAGLLRALVAASCLLPLMGACGGRSDTEDYLFGSDGTISVGASSSSAGSFATGGGTRSGGGANGTGASGTISAGSGPIGIGASGPIGTGGTGPIGGGGVNGFGGTLTGGTGFGGTGFGGISMGGAGVAGSATAGAAGNPAVTPISCGQQTCDANTQVCCAGLGGFGCLAKNKTCNGAVLSCTTPSDCPGNELCCVAVTGDIANASSCKNRCDNMGNGHDRQICDVDADCQFPFRFCTTTIFGINICTRRP